MNLYNHLSSEIGKMLIPVDPRRSPVTLRQINKVAQLGRNGLPCDILFKDCDALAFLPIYILPNPTVPIPLNHPLLKRSGVGLLLNPLKTNKSF
jgi:hypothetical protein